MAMARPQTGKWSRLDHEHLQRDTILCELRFQLNLSATAFQNCCYVMEIILCTIPDGRIFFVKV